jgi:hypothetical protein
LTLTNAIIVTAAVSRQLFPREQHPVNERNLAITTGLGNLLSAPFGGYLRCHGAGGIAGHFRFGGRTATSLVLIGLIFFVLGLGFGESGYVCSRRFRMLYWAGCFLSRGSSLPYRRSCTSTRAATFSWSAYGRDWGRAEPGGGVRCRPADCLRIQAPVVHGVTHLIIPTDRRWRLIVCALLGGFATFLS